jgi:hypothetical protein
MRNSRNGVKWMSYVPYLIANERYYVVRHRLIGTFVYFAFTYGTMSAKWPNNTLTVYCYKNGAIETHTYNAQHGAEWDAAAGTYVIDVGDISGNGVSCSEDHPIIVAMPFTQGQQQYYLAVSTSPSGVNTIPGQGFYNNGTTATLTAPATVTVSGTSEYSFSYWDIDGVSQGSTNPISFLMTSNHTATAHYVMQYLVTLAQSGLSSAATGNVLTVNGQTETYSSLPYSIWVTSGGTVAYSFNSIVAASVTGEQFRLNSVTGSSSPITVSGAITITGNYVPQYQVTFSQTGLDSSATRTVVTVNSAANEHPRTIPANSCRPPLRIR